MSKSFITLALVSAFCLESCVWQYFMRDEYSGSAPKVIADHDGKPVSQNWLVVPEDALPASHSEQHDTISYASDGIPYGFRSSYRNIVVSPYPPFRYLNYSGISVGSKVWDPYSRKPFYIPMSYTIN